MSNLNNTLPLARTIIVGVVGFFTIICFGISAHIVSVARSGIVPAWAGLALATSILTILALPVLFVVPIIRRGALLAFVAVELLVIWILWVLWLATAGSIASLSGLNRCSVGLCPQVRALEAFAFLNWLILMFYGFTVLILSVVAHSRGQTNVWRSSVQEFDWHRSKGGVTGYSA